MRKSFQSVAVFVWLLALAPLTWAQSLEQDDAEAAGYENQILITIDNPTTVGMSSPGSTWKGWSYGGGYNISAPITYRVSKLVDEFDLRVVTEWPISMLEVHCIIVELPAGANRAELLEKITRHPYVEDVEPVQLYATQSSGRAYNDPYLDLQKGLSQMQIMEAHSLAQGVGVKVGIVDTGINYNHPDLRGQVIKAKDLVRQRGDLFTDDQHGTAIAGIIAALADNQEGIVGVAPKTHLLAFKACWPVGENAAAARCTNETISRALQAAKEADIDILNLSLSGPPSGLLAEQIRLLIEDGVVVVGAVPEKPVKGGVFPATVPGVIAVRNQVPSTVNNVKTYMAPGIDVITTTAAGKYEYESGSSLSTAHVTGVVALLKELRPELTLGEIRSLLDRATNQGEAVQLGSVNACMAVNELLGDGVCDVKVALNSISTN